MSTQLNAFGQGLIGGVQTGAAISEHNMRKEQWNMYKSRSAETDATNAMVTTLADGYGGDIDAMLNDPIGQQIAFDFIQKNDVVKGALESNKGWKPKAMMKDDSGTFVVMMTNDDGEVRPLTVDRKTGTEPLRLGQEDVYKLMGASASKLGITNNPQMMRYVTDLVGGEEQAKTFLGADVSTTIPKASSLSAVAPTARKSNGVSPVIPSQNAPELVQQQSVEAAKPTKVNRTTVPTNLKDDKELVETRHNAALSDLTESGFSFDNLPRPVQEEIARQQQQNEVNLDALSLEERQRMLGDEADPTAQVPPLGQRPVLADEDPNARFFSYLNRVNQAAADGAYTDQQVAPLDQRPVLADVNPTPQTADYLSKLKGNTSFFDTIINNIREESRAESQQRLMSQYNGNPDSQVEQTLNANQPSRLEQRLNEQVAGEAVPLGQINATDWASVPRRLGESINNIASTAVDVVTGQAGNEGAEREKSAPRRLGESVRNVGEQLYDASLGQVKAYADRAVTGLKSAGEEFLGGIAGTEKEEKQTEEKAASSVNSTLEREAVRHSDFKDPERRANVESGINQRVASEQPDVRIENDIRALEAIGKDTRRPTSKQLYAAMRLYQSDLLPKDAYTEFLQTGKLSHKAQELAIAELQARTDFIRAKTAAAREAGQQRDYLEKRGKDAFEVAKKQYEQSVDSGSTGMLEYLGNNQALIEHLTATGVKPEDYAKNMTNVALSLPQNVLAVTNGRTANKYEMFPHEVNMAQQATAAYIFDKWRKPEKGGWFGRDKAPVTGGNVGDINLSRYLKVNEEGQE